MLDHYENIKEILCYKQSLDHRTISRHLNEKNQLNK